jgi:hypothetical protein
MAANARRFEKRQNVLVEGKILFIRRGREFGDINSTDIPFFGSLILSGGVKTGQQKCAKNYRNRRFHSHVGGTMAKRAVIASKRWRASV